MKWSINGWNSIKQKEKKTMKQLKDFKTINESEKDSLIRVCDSIKNLDSSVEVILYGSRARGEAASESDYDLLILTDEEATLKREDAFRRQLYPIELETGAVLTVILTSRKNWRSPLYSAMPLYQNIEEGGIIL